MEYLRKFLIELRKRENQATSGFSFSKKMVIVVLVGSFIGGVVDSVIPFGFWFNMLRGIIAVIVGGAMFSYSYLWSIKDKDRKIKKDRYYNPLRKRFSFNQRVNIAILGGIIIVVFMLTIGGVQNAFYTFQSALMIFAIISLVAFARKDRNEFLSSIYEIPDVRDLRFQNELENKKEVETEEEVD